MQAKDLIKIFEIEPKEAAKFLKKVPITVETVLALREIMMATATSIDGACDIVGTGGDRRNTFNVSTCAAIVMAASGAKVAKYGNRSTTSASGSGNVLDALGIPLATSLSKAQKSIDAQNIAFLSARTFHPLFLQAAEIRKHIRGPSIFNVVGPITNPALPKQVLIGCYSPYIMAVLSSAASKIRYTKALFCNGHGLDEIAIHGESLVTEYTRKGTHIYRVSPEMFGYKKGFLKYLQIQNPMQSAEYVREVLCDSLCSDAMYARRLAVILNAGVGLYAANHTKTIQKGIEKAVDAIESRRAATLLEKLQE